MIEVWTDGACSGNPGAGGWGVLLIAPKGEETFSGATPHTTNNRMELTAAIKALEICVAKHSAEEINLYTDSEYVKKGITEWSRKWEQNGWRTAARKPVKNADLWQALLLLNKKLTVEWHWVKAHSNITNNERADFLATSAIKN